MKVIHWYELLNLLPDLLCVCFDSTHKVKYIPKSGLWLKDPILCFGILWSPLGCYLWHINPANPISCLKQGFPHYTVRFCLSFLRTQGMRHTPVAHFLPHAACTHEQDYTSMTFATQNSVSVFAGTFSSLVLKSTILGQGLTLSIWHPSVFGILVNVLDRGPRCGASQSFSPSAVFSGWQEVGTSSNSWKSSSKLYRRFLFTDLCAERCRRECKSFLMLSLE